VPTCTSAGCTVTADDAFTIELDITNHGSMAGKTVVQIYFSQDLCSRVRFSKMLLGFGKVEVAGGTTSKSVKMPLKARELEMWDRASNRYVVEDASYTLQVGQWVSDPQMQHKTLHVSSG
jgi:beta-glucosidase